MTTTDSNARRTNTKANPNAAPGANALGAIEGLLGGLNGLLQTVHSLAEKGDSMQRERAFTTKDGSQGRMHFGISVRTLGDSGRIDIQPFGNLRTDGATGQAVVEETREPITDVFAENQGVLVIAEMPGINTDDLRVELSGDVLTIAAATGEKRYATEILLDRPCDPATLTTAMNNGIVEIRAAFAP